MLNTTLIEKKCDEVSSLLKLISHPSRLRILCALLGNRKNVSELESEVGISQSSISQFLKMMHLEDILDRERNGQQVFYWIKDKRVNQLMHSLYEIFCKGEPS